MATRLPDGSVPQARPRPRASEEPAPSQWTLQEFRTVWAEQGGVCAICLEPDYRRLSKDHDHITGKKRGLLCHACNRLVGSIERRIGLEGATRLVQYLQKHQS